MIADGAAGPARSSGSAAMNALELARCDQRRASPAAFLVAIAPASSSAPLLIPGYSAPFAIRAMLVLACAAGGGLGRPDAGRHHRRHRPLDPLRHRLRQRRRGAALRRRAWNFVAGLRCSSACSRSRSARLNGLISRGAQHPSADRHARHRHDRPGAGAALDEGFPSGSAPPAVSAFVSIGGSVGPLPGAVAGAVRRRA